MARLLGFPAVQLKLDDSSTDCSDAYDSTDDSHWARMNPKAKAKIYIVSFDFLRSRIQKGTVQRRL